MRNLMRHVGAVLCAVVVTGLSARLDAASFDPGVKWRQLTSEHFMVYFDDAMEPVAQRAAQVAEEAHAILSEKYQWKPLGRTALVLTDSNDTANGFASVLPYNYLLIRITAPGPDSVLANYDDWLRLLIMHEYTHIIHMDQVGGILRVPRLLLGKVVSPNGMLPGWMREGLASYEESQSGTGRSHASVSDMMLRTAIWQKQFPKIDQADGLGWRWPGFLAQYIYGVKFLQWLADTYGEEKLVEFQRRSGRSLLFFMHNHIAKRVWKKSFYKLWKEWQRELKAQYTPQIAALRTAGLSEGELVSDDGQVLSAMAIAPDGSKLVYTTASPHRQVEMRVRNLADGTEALIRKQAATSAQFDPTGRYLVYAALGSYKRYNFVADIYLYDFETKQLKRLTAGRRAQHPSFAPDGKSLLYVVEKRGRQWIAQYTLATRREKIVPIDTGPHAQFSDPVWSPDGKRIAVSSWQQGTHDIYIYHPNGEVAQRVTHDRAIDMQPTWDASSRDLYFASDRSGVTNIYRYDHRRQRIDQVTNVVTGVFGPAITKDGASLYAQYFNGQGYDLRKYPLGKVWASSSVPAERRAWSTASKSHADPLTNGSGSAEALPSYETKKYNPFGPRLFLPRYLSPNFIATDSGLLVTAITGGSDPLRWHNWLGGATYRTDASYLGYFFNYAYNRYKPVFNLGMSDYAVNFGNLTFLRSDGTLNTVHMYEKRIRGYAGFSLPIRSSAISLNYFFEDRDNIPTLTAEERALLNLDRFAGASATFAWGKLEQYPASISIEKGHKLVANVTITDKLLGSIEKNEQQIVTAEYREFLKLPWRHHVIALRAKGGVVFGDTLVQGTYAMGGDLGEGSLGGGGSLFYFPLRGLPVASLARTRAALISGEYRLPLFSPQRGIGTTPFFLKNAHAAVFADWGNAWNAHQHGGPTGIDLRQFFLGTGVELVGDFVLGHGLPVVGRLGYGVIVVNRDRLGTLKDPLLGTTARNGLLILQLGSSF